MDGTQKDMGPPGTLQPESCRLFRSLQTSHQRKTHCTEVRLDRHCSIAAPGLPLSYPSSSRRTPEPGTTEFWTAAKRTSDHQGLRGTEGAFFQERSSIVPAESPLR